MGLKFSSAKDCKEGSVIFVYSEFPEGEHSRKLIWDLWKIKKEEIKAEGFSVGMDKRTKRWIIKYFHTKNNQTYEKTKDGVYFWKFEMDQKLKKLEVLYNKLQEFKLEETNIEKEIKLEKANIEREIKAEI